jgi:hypothetical protein
MAFYKSRGNLFSQRDEGNASWMEGSGDHSFPSTFMEIVHILISIVVVMNVRTRKRKAK